MNKGDVATHLYQNFVFRRPVVRKFTIEDDLGFCGKKRRWSKKGGTR